MKSPRVSLYVLLARDAPRGVVLRRGPSKQVLLISWHTDSDRFYPGQWFKGRIYERRCDLSPKGEHLLYFAASWRRPYGSWTAISRPPYLTALALWPKGDAWGGGGLYQGEHTILLDHRAEEMVLAPEFTLPKKIRVRPLGAQSGTGGEGIDYALLQANGWQLVDYGERIKHPLKAKVWIEYLRPELWIKRKRVKGRIWELRMMFRGIGERDGPWYLIDYEVVSKNNLLQLEKTDWADWAYDGDLLFARNGRVFRLGFGREGLLPVDQAKCLIDLNGQKFAECRAPASALKW